MNELIVSGQRLVSGGALLQPGWLAVRDDKIASVTAGSPPVRPDASAAVLLPGFVDLHTHGGGGAGFDGDAERAVAYHRAHGTTSQLASLMTASLDALHRQLARLDPLVRRGDLLGVHLEGPWLSPHFAGAHDPALLRAPSSGGAEELLRTGLLAMVTLAPELPGAMELTRTLRDAGVVVAIGHTAADASATTRAIETGARVATHLFNAMPPAHHREPGPVPVLLGDERVVVELVADGAHVHPAVLRLAIRAAGAHRVALVTDATSAAGRPDGPYRLGTRPVDVRAGTVRLAGTDTLAGSTLTMDRALRYVVEHCGVPLEHAAGMAASTPARVLGRSELGDLRPGARADVVLLDDGLRVERVLRAGSWVKPAEVLS